MANIVVWCLRDTATKTLMGWSLDPFSVQIGQEQVQETIDEVDYSRFNTKYRFNRLSGDLEINGKTFHQLQIINDTIAHNPVDGSPQITKDGINYITVTLQKEDIDGNDLIGADDNDTVLIRPTGGIPTIKDSAGSAEISQVDLVKGTAQFRVYSDVNLSVVSITLMAENLKDGFMQVESV